jgi:hypothetical protein
MRLASLLSAAVSLVLVSGCIRPKPGEVREATTLTSNATNRVANSDSTQITDRLKFRAVGAPADSATTELQLKAGPDGQLLPVASSAGGSRASVRVTVTPDGKARISCRCDAWRDSVATLERTVTRLRSQKATRDSVLVRDRWRERTLVRTVPRPVAWFDWVARGLAVILMLIMLILLYRRHHRKPQKPESDELF